MTSDLPNDLGAYVRAVMGDFRVLLDEIGDIQTHRWWYGSDVPLPPHLLYGNVARMHREAGKTSPMFALPLRPSGGVIALLAGLTAGELEKGL